MKNIMQNFKALPYSESIKILEHASQLPVQNGKIMHMVIGANGAGKSTLIANLYAQQKLSVPYLNADILQRAKYKDIADETERNKLAMFETMDNVEQSIKNGNSFVYESVFSHPSKLDFLKTAKQLGYKIYIYFITTETPAINVDRVRIRVAQGGHNVPTNKIIDRYYRTTNLAKKSIEFCDEFHLLDNSEDREIEDVFETKNLNEKCL